jgi:hypothetical protein
LFAHIVFGAVVDLLIRALVDPEREDQSAAGLQPVPDHSLALKRQLLPDACHEQATPDAVPSSVNQRRPFFSRNPNIVGISYALSDGLSSYQAFQLTVEKRFSAGFTFLSGYTWSHNIDTIGNDFGGGSGVSK